MLRAMQVLLARRESARARGRRDRPRRGARDRPAAGPRHDRRRGRRRAARPAPAAGGRGAVRDPDRPRRRGAGRAAPLDRARDGGGRTAPVAGRQGRDRAGHRRRLLLRLRVPGADLGRRPRPDRGRRCGGSSPASIRSSAPTASTRRAGGAVPRRGPAVQAGAGRGPSRRRDQRLRPGRVRGSVPRAAPADHQADQGLQAALAGRRLLARRLDKADADPDLRHRVLRPGRRWTRTWSGSRRRAAATTAGSAASSTCSTSARSRPAGRSGIPRGHGDLERADRALARAEPRARLPRGAHADPLSRRAVEAVRATGTSTATNMFFTEKEERRARPEADELPGARPDLRRRPAQLPRPADAPGRAGPGAPRRAVRHAARPDARPPHHAGRRAHLLHATSRSRTR